MRQSLIALRLAERLGLDEATRGVVYYVGLIAWVGCHVDAYEQAKWFGDDMALKADAHHVDMAGLPAKAFIVEPRRRRPGAGRARSPEREVRRRRAARRRRDDRESLAGDQRAGGPARTRSRRCARACTRRSSAGTARGCRRRPRASEILVPARLVNLADVVEVYHRTGGVDAAIAVARERSGTQFDPALVDVFCSEAPTLFERHRLGDDLAGGDRGRAGARDRALRRGAGVRAGGDRRLHRPQVALDDRPLARRRRPRSARPRRSTGCRTPTPSSCAGPGWSTISAASASPTRSGTSRAR